VIIYNKASVALDGKNCALFNGRQKGMAFILKNHLTIDAI
jgi:hypothetical protein